MAMSPAMTTTFMTGKPSRPDELANPPARRGVVRVVPTLAALAAIALFVTAGNWQRGRMHQKEALGAQLAAAATAPAQSLPRDVDWMTWRFRLVEVTGRFDAERQ